MTFSTLIKYRVHSYCSYIGLHASSELVLTGSDEYVHVMSIPHDSHATISFPAKKGKKKIDAHQYLEDHGHRLRV